MSARRQRADKTIAAVAAEIRRLDPNGTRSARVLRETFDQLYDGQRTGRYRWDQLYKTEKTHCGTLVEINLHREFEFEDGTLLDYRIAGSEVDCKYSQAIGGWMIPPEARDQVCLVVSATDSATPTWNMGVVRTSADRLNLGANRDAKATLNLLGRQSIIWIARNAPLPINVLLTLNAAAIQRIFAHTSGQKRINELFRCALGKTIGRAAVATVARQDDYMKRVRANGGARTHLQPEGVIILGQFTSHVRVALDLGVPVPGRGDSVAVQLAPVKKRGPGVAEIGGKLWRIARANDVIVAAPDLPSI
jgi:hypothetical protein